MSRWDRPSGGRHARGRVSPVGVSAASPMSAVPTADEAVRLVFADGTAVALTADDPRARAFRTLADELAGPHSPPAAQADAGDADHLTVGRDGWVTGVRR